VELKHRRGTEIALVPTGEITARLEAEIAALRQAAAPRQALSPFRQPA
jgi:hypothetical protein